MNEKNVFGRRSFLKAAGVALASLGFKGSATHAEAIKIKPNTVYANIPYYVEGIICEIKDLPYAPTNFIELIDSVNSDWFGKFAPGMLKFCGGSTSREFNSDGSISQDIQLRFETRKYPWNYLPDYLGNWEPFDGNPIYPEIDLRTRIPYGECILAHQTGTTLDYGFIATPTPDGSYYFHIDKTKF